jgi:hypothetical protein
VRGPGDTNETGKIASEVQRTVLSTPPKPFRVADSTISYASNGPIQETRYSEKGVLIRLYTDENAVSTETFSRATSQSADLGQSGHVLAGGGRLDEGFD